MNQKWGSRVSNQDKQVIKSMTIVTAAIAALGIGAFFIAQNVSDKNAPAAQKSKRAEAALKDRIKKVGTVEVAGAASNSAPKEARPAKVVLTSCVGCHASGALGAPKIGSKGDWEPRVAGGIDALVKSAIAGKGNMPPRGGGDFNAEELKAAIQSMLADSGL